MLRRHIHKIRVRYQETDAQGHVHHANFLSYFEIGRVEQMRASGYSYRELEEQGTMLVIAKASCSYLKPAFYDDELELETVTTRATGTRVEHKYELRRGSDVLVRGETVLACLDRESGRVCRLPDWMKIEDD